MDTYRKLIVVIGMLLIGGCASIPKESPELSQEIGRRVAAMQQAHLSLVHKYFDLKREEINRMFEEEWIPAYAESFFGQPQVSDYWNRLVSEDDREERLRFLTQMGPRMLEEIRSRREAFMEPLDDLEDEIEDSLRAEYQRILSANNTLTSFLSSSSKVVQNRQRYLEMFGVEQQAIDTYIDRADRRSEQIMETIKNAKIK